MALIDQAIALHQAGQLAEAEPLYRRCLEADAGDFDALHMLGIICAQRDRLDDAERWLRVALGFDLGVAACHYNYATVLTRLNRFQDAIDSYDKALAIAPEDVQIYVDRGAAERKLGRIDAALTSHARALTIDPACADAHLNQGICHLLRGDFERGWAGYEWRWEAPSPLSKRDFPQPRWNGHDDIAAKSILLHAEQGFGDTIQFCRFAEMVAAKGAKVILEVHPPLKRLLANLRGVERLVARDEEPLPDFDYHCPLLSVPLALGTRIDTIPARVPYLEAPPPLVEHWARRLGRKERPRLGIAWSGNSEHDDDASRSMTLAQLSPLLSPAWQVVSLQKDVRERDVETLRTLPHVLHAGGDFCDTAALIALMDVVISIDTSIAHLAGALGAPTWVLLPFAPDWRWLLDRSDSPWYPTMRLFRQPGSGDWEHVIETVGRALSTLLEQWR